MRNSREFRYRSDTGAKGEGYTMGELIAATQVNQLWHMAPLIVAISLVYGATRHELMRPILINSLRAGWWIVSFMGVIFLVLFVLGWQA
ncbi:MAG: hypothetical protein AB7F89_10500 [Pirellulaceae bacterium]